MVSGAGLLLLLAAAVIFIIYGTARLKLHPFLVLLVAAIGLGILAGLPVLEVISSVTEGFGNTLGYIGIVIAAGTIIGTVLEKSGGALVLAESIVRWIGKARSALAMSLAGAVISIPVFCDSGFIILSSLNRTLAERARKSMATFAVALSMGLYTTHVFVPPTPGPIAAAAELGADIGTVIIFGILVSIPVLITTYIFAAVAGKRIHIEPVEAMTGESDNVSEHGAKPGIMHALLPVAVPVILIALKSIADLPSKPLGDSNLTIFIRFIGDPNIALILGVVLAFIGARDRGKKVYSDWVGAALKQAGSIILITGAGGALGHVLQETAIGDYLGSTEGDEVRRTGELLSVPVGDFNILMPFLRAAALKTTLGSSTVAIITTASLVGPLLPSMELASEMGFVLATLSIGAGAMTVSHANDSYFWVVTQFSGMSVREGYKLQTLGSAVAGITGAFSIVILAFVIL